MLFRQLLDVPSHTFTYLVASRRGGDAVLIDPVREQLDYYLRLIEALDLRLAYAIDTHTHHDHASALENLYDRGACVTAMGRESTARYVTRRLRDGEVLELDDLELEVMHTPGHTEDSYCLVMDDRVFTGDTLLIRGTGRTDLGGDPRQQFRSLFGRILQLPGRTLVYPAHDYNGRHVSNIADERRENPRLQSPSMNDYVSIMDSLRPADPRLTDIPERPSLHPSAPLMRQLLTLKATLTAGNVLGNAPVG